MFAPPVAKPKSEAATDTASQPAFRNLSFIARPSGGGAVEQMQKPCGSLVGSGASWNFGDISLFSRDGSDHAHSEDTASATQPKLLIGRINDPLEGEADRVADQVMRTPANAFAAVSAGPTQISRKCALCEAIEKKKKKEVQLKSAGSGNSVGEAPAIVHQVLRSPGQPIDAGTRAFFEPRFGRSFSHIRVHTDLAAAASAQAIGARAYTRGSHIVFAGGHYQTGTSTGRHLLAHELAHTAQQEQGASGQIQRAICSEFNESSKKECEENNCITRDGAQGRCKKTGLHVCECFPKKLWRLMPDWLIAVVGAAVLAAIVACFATGVCEFAAVVAGLGALTAAAVIGILKAAGIKDSGA